ncbi:helix-turn-helix domain-containing protein [Apilactobacillus timberlakei]|uniref:Helix-turn-helix domain-containing protein n=1 Tax=Apilactobacillus timberlakei TaxID=2008380 RepID=A0ABY2YRX8_9LACO|nr:helix-turn-helix domain-containing protein [Apilactobacillus timberlakei]TPR12967.1 helix-turn-helix domain-containing protein [Apilactobacillus timberlakei]
MIILKPNPFLSEVYKLEQEVGSVATLDDNDPRIKRLSEMSNGRSKQEIIKPKVLYMIHKGMSTPEIAKSLGCTATYIRRLIKKYHLVINYVVIEDVKTNNKLFFMSAITMLEVFKENNINIGYKSILNHLENGQLYNGRYKLYRDKKIKALD